MEQKFNITLVLIIILSLAVNIVFLDVIVFSEKKSKDKIVADVVSIPTPETVDTTCPVACTKFITSEIAKVTPLPTLSAVPKLPTPTQFILPREFYVPLGIGKTVNYEWEELPGAEAYIDTRLYPNIKQVIFEVYLRIPAGIGWMYAKLYNATDKHDVWGSEVSSESNKSVRKESNINLDPGNKLYRVMVKSTLRSEAYLDNARIKIITN